MKRTSIVRIAVLLLSMSCTAAPRAQASGYTLTTLHSFSGSTHGDMPTQALTLGKDGSFYGTTRGGGAYGGGTIFKITPAGVLTTLYSFTGVADGNQPAEPLVQGTDGNFYGMTDQGGAHVNGTIFKITPAGVLTSLYSFTGGADGNWPTGALTQGSDESFYGTTEYGGAKGGANGHGNIFRITSAGVFTTIYSFNGGNDGSDPIGSLTKGTDGNFYGTTTQDGANYGGTAYRITPTGAFTTIYTFTGGNDGAQPYAPLTLGSDGNFYGTTPSGGAHSAGTVFKVTPAGGLTTLYAFTGAADGGHSQAPLTLGKDGSFYGTTPSGGANGAGTFFKMTSAGALTTISSFNWAATPFSAGGIQTTLTLGADGNFYSADGFGGANGAVGLGTVYKVTPAGVMTTLYSFTSGSDAEWPIGSLVQAPNGNFYGTTFIGGAYSAGTVYQITPSGTLTTLHAFTGWVDGGYPMHPLTLGPDENVYGTTMGGGYNGAGTFFKITPAGVLSPIYSFTSSANSAAASLTLGVDGNFYGAAENAGPDGDGTVFRITPKGALTTLYSFTAYTSDTDGERPQSCITLGSDGNFYGATKYVGANGNGTIFKITPTGTLTTLHAFTGASDGGGPVTPLMLGADGNFYGGTQIGGASSLGTLFKMTPSGALTTFYSFTGNTYNDDLFLMGNLCQAINGNILGTTPFGGANGYGSVFEVTPSGSLTTLHSFACAEGALPYAGVLQGADGSYYGTTLNGGAYGGGAVFKLTPPAGSNYALWTNSGEAGLWKIPASGAVASASFGPIAGWTPAGLTSDASGNAYVLWTSTTGAAAVWKVSSSLAVTASQALGPYTGWTAKSFAVGPDGHVHVLWNHIADNEASLFNFAFGSSASSKAYGPFAGWQATQIAVDCNNNTRVLWTDSATSQAALWNITTAGVQTSQSFGPFAGWQPQSLALAPGGQQRMVWVSTSTKQASVFTIAPNGSFASQAIGPYTGWTASGLAVNNDGDSEMIWTSTSNQLSLFDIASTGAITSNSYGPISGWKAIAVAPGP